MVKPICQVNSLNVCFRHKITNFLCKPFSKFRASNKHFTNIAYVVFSLFWALVSIILMFAFRHVFNQQDKFDCRGEQSKELYECSGTAAVARMSISLAIFHLFILWLISGRKDYAAAFLEGWWILKMLIMVGIYAAVFWIPNDFYQGFNHFAILGSAIYMFMQSFIVNISAYTINDSLVEIHESQDPEKPSKVPVCLILSLTIIFYGLTFAILALNFYWFSHSAVAIIITIETIVFIISFALLTLLKTRKDYSFLTASLVSLYIAYLSWSGLSSMPSQQWNSKLIDSKASTAIQIILGFMFTAFTLIVVVGTDYDEPEGEGIQGQINNIPEKQNKDIENQQAENKVSTDVSENNNEENKHTNIQPITTEVVLFHIVMLFLSLYYLMLLTNWNDRNLDHPQKTYDDSNWTKFWITLIAQLICSGIYVWSLVAPKFQSSRNFY